MTFARNLQRLMDERRVGVRELAKRAGTSPANISDYRAGVAPTDFKLVRRIAAELGVTIAFLLTGEDDVRPDGAEPSVAEVLEDGGQIYDGYARITIQRLIPRHTKSSSGGSDG